MKRRWILRHTIKVTIIGSLCHHFVYEASGVFVQALEMDEGYQRAKEGLNKAQKKQKLKKKRDYYKILGVKKTATKKEINKAYR